MAHEAFRPITGQWQNEMGSILTIDELNKESGYFIGFYQTADSIPNEAGEKISIDEKWPLHGTVSGDVISFIVDYSKDNPNLCTWAGNIDTKEDMMRLTWLLVSTILPRKNTQNEPTPHWASTKIGRDYFNRR